VIFLAAFANLFLLRGISSSRPADRTESLPIIPVLKESLAFVRKDRTFWLIAGFFFFLVVVANAMPLHLPLILQERGATRNIQALSLTITGVSMVIARPLLGWVLDRFPTRWVLALMMAGPLAGTLGLLVSGTTLVALISAAGFGMALGGEIVCLSFILSRAFSQERFGPIFGWFMLVLALAGAAGPISISALVKWGGGYNTALMMMAVACVLSLIFCTFLNDSRVRPTAAVLVQQGV
jgi:MFS family permease